MGLYWGNIQQGAEIPYPTDGLVARWEYEDTNFDTISGYAMNNETGYITGKIGKCAITTASAARHECTNIDLRNVEGKNFE